MTTLEWVKEKKIIAIVRGLPPTYMRKLAEALYQGGINLMEVTFQQAKPETWQDTGDAIRNISAHMEGRMLVGAGTVMNERQLELARAAGAEYIITPNTNPQFIRKVKACGLISFSGALTPSEIVAAFEAGADAVKVFPAGQLGPAYIKAVRAPLAHIPLMAVGGVNEKNARDFISAGCCGVGVGGNLVNKEWIEQGQWDKITALAAEYRKAVG
ncbi:MAG: bifunctional 4-hydroxy-2-oxoglutarate aldolase/2-dehydro-3-deoxy-phosphogluconate aldolase [Clostridia bacterium]